MNRETLLHGRTRAALVAGIRAKIVAALALLFFSSVMASSAQYERGGLNERYRVLVLHSFRNSLPVNTDWYKGIMRAFASASDLRIEVDIEAPDLTRFADSGYVSNLFEIYRRKYLDEAPDLIIPTYTPAYKFLLEHGEDLFPDVPIVFCGADSLFVTAQERASHITGIPRQPDIAGTVALALQLHPDARRIAVIVGSGAMDKLFEGFARKAVRPFEERVRVTWLQGMPLGELMAAVQQLPRDTPLLYLVQLEDRTGRTYVPIDTTRQLASVANAPIFGLWDTLIGHGIIGGRLATLEEDGFQAAQIGLRILRGKAPAAIPVVFRKENPAIVDARELARWSIDQGRLPAGSQIRHHQLSVWDQYRKEIVTAVAIILVQGFSIGALLLNRRRLRQSQAALQDEYDRRSQAETIAVLLRGRLARFGKTRSLGTMATAIAHEINQPLIAIQNYAQAARRRLKSNVDQRPKLGELFEKIEAQADRAGAITQRVRALVSADDPDLLPVNLGSVLKQVIGMMEQEVENLGCRIEYESVADASAVLADALQVQLVLANLLQNAMQSICSANHGDKRVCVDVRQISDREVQVSVTDRGPGVPPQSVEDIFDPLYSERSGGTGMGLAICRNIVEAHGGRLWYEPNPAGGAIFRFTLPVAES